MQHCGTHVRHFNAQSAAAAVAATSRAARPLFFVKLGTQSDTLFRFIILYNRPYAVLFIATHANQQTAPPGSTTKIN